MDGIAKHYISEAQEAGSVSSRKQSSTPAALPGRIAGAPAARETSFTSSSALRPEGKAQIQMDDKLKSLEDDIEGFMSFL